MENPTVSYIYRIEEGAPGVRQTLYVMRDVVRETARDPDFIEYARKLLSGIPPKDWQREILALFHFVRNNIRYTLDPDGTEVLATPWSLLQMGSGDCDEMAMLLAALLKASGKPVRFVAVGFDAGDLSHVYVEVKNGDKWIPLDVTEPYAPGWEPEDIKERFTVNI